MDDTQKHVAEFADEYNWLKSELKLSVAEINRSTFWAEDMVKLMRNYANFHYKMRTKFETNYEGYKQP